MDVVDNDIGEVSLCPCRAKLFFYDIGRGFSLPLIWVSQENLYCIAVEVGSVFDGIVYAACCGYVCAEDHILSWYLLLLQDSITTLISWLGCVGLLIRDYIGIPIWHKLLRQGIFLLFEMMAQKPYGTGNAKFIRKNFGTQFIDFNIGEFK